MNFSTIAKIHEFVKQQKNWQPFGLKEYYQNLQKGYRSQSLQGYSSTQHVQAYVFSRLPATYAVAYKLLARHFQNTPIKSVIDWGCGVGTASLALADLMTESVDYYFIESNGFALELSQEFMQMLHGEKHRLHSSIPENEVDIAIMSYSLNELGNNWQETVAMLWQKSKYLLIIEPGTNNIFQNLSKVRDFLIGYGAQVIAPCFHQYACKLSKTNDWCHFQERIARTKEMRFLKNAERGYEDEAYAYLLVSKENKVDLSNANSRIIANPMQHGGHLALKLCKSDGKIENVTLSKKNDIYQKAKKLKWGDDYVL